VFRDLDQPNADLQQLAPSWPPKFIGAMDARKLSTRKAEAITGLPAADFSRIRNAELGRFTVDRLMKILGNSIRILRF